MRNELGVLLIEDSNGEISVQLFSKPDGVDAMFDNLNGKVTDKPSRATYCKLFYAGGRIHVVAEFKDLPVVKGDRSDGYLIGEGPINLDKGEK